MYGARPRSTTGRHVAPPSRPDSPLQRLAALSRANAQPNVRGSAWRLGYTSRFWALLLPISLLAGMAGTGLRLLLRFVEHSAWGYHAGEQTNAVGATGAAHRILILGAAGLLAGGIWWAMRRWWGTTGGGLNDTLWSGEADTAFLPTLISAALSTTIIAMGASIGREQPPKDAGATIACWIAKRGGVSRQERCLLMAFAAGGAWAAVYNIPLGGGVFAAEVLVGTLALPIVVPALASSVVAVAVSWTLVSVHPYYQGIAAYQPTTSLIVFGIIAGPILGLGAMAFVWLLGLVNIRRVSGNWVLIGPLVAFLLLGLLAIPYPQLLGNGRDIGQDVLLGGLTTATIAALFVLKPLVTAMCWGSGARGGMFTPTTAYGALFGALLGRGWSALWPSAASGAYGLVGATAVLAAGMAAPVSAVVLMVELTGGTMTTILVPSMLAVAGASLTARLLGGGSIYSSRLPLDKPATRWSASGIWNGKQATGDLLPGFAASIPDQEANTKSDGPLDSNERPVVDDPPGSH
jgi:CIC family chloride channel protein